MLSMQYKTLPYVLKAVALASILFAQYPLGELPLPPQPPRRTVAERITEMQVGSGI